MKIAALTMVRNDDFYLRKWVEYYGAQLGRENLYIYFDGLDQAIPAFCEGLHTVKVEKIGTDVRSNDKGRARYLSARAAELFAGGYERVMGTDADEFIVVDPRLGLSLPEYLSHLPAEWPCISALGLDVGQRPEEADIREDAPFLQQRQYALIGTRYTKASILARPLEWGSGFHRVEGKNFHIAPELYLLHLGYFDRKRIEARFADTSRREQGWERHLNKRLRTIREVSAREARDFDSQTARARRLQRFCRPVYAWNKPAMLGLQWVVRIPERFQEVL